MEVSVITPSDVFQNFQFSEKKDCDPKFMNRNEKSLFSFFRQKRRVKRSDFWV